MTTIQESAFSNCNNLTAIYVDEEIPAYRSVDGVLYNKTVTELLAFPENHPQTAFNIPESVTRIAGNDDFISGGFHGRYNYAGLWKNDVLEHCTVGQRIEGDANDKLFFRFSKNRPRSLGANGRLTAIIRHIIGEY